MIILRNSKRNWFAVFLMNRNTREVKEAPKKSAKMKQFLVSNREEKCRISVFGCEIGGNLVK